MLAQSHRRFFSALASSFLDAYDPMDGKCVWRFWTVPAAGESGSETWPAEVWERGGGPTWLTGTYDPELNLS